MGGHLEDSIGGDDELDRYEELLADDVLWGLDESEADELARLAAGREDHATEQISFEAAGGALAGLLTENEEPPAEVRARIEAMALHFLASEKGLTVAQVARARRERALDTGSSAPQQEVSRSSSSRSSDSPRVAPAPRPDARAVDESNQAPPSIALRRRLAFTQVLAAASLLVAVSLFLTRGSNPPEAIDGADLYAQLTEPGMRRELVRYEWTMPGDAAVPEGEVLWDPQLQTGVMRFRNLTSDLPRDALQLWIFDGERDKAHPVDGGVFDPASDGTRAADGSLFVPIQAKLPVSEAFAFAVTAETTKGVVVSDRQHIVSLAGQIERL